MRTPPATAAPALDERLSYRIGLAGRLLRAWADAELADLGVTAQALALLRRLSEEDGLTQADLARRGRVEASTVCRMVDRLVRDALVERRGDPADRRTVRVHLTEAGRGVVARGMAVVGELDDRVTARLGASERDQLAELLGRVLAELPEPAGP